jgi:hypothetical protein
MIPVGPHIILALLLFSSLPHFRCHLINADSLVFQDKRIDPDLNTTVSGRPKRVSSTLVHPFIPSSGSYSYHHNEMSRGFTPRITAHPSSLVHSIYEAAMLMSL